MKKAKKDKAAWPFKKSLILVLLSLVLSAVLSSLIWQKWVAGEESARLASASQNYLQQQQKVVTDYLEALNRQVLEVGGTDALAKAILTNNLAIKEVYQDRLLQEIKGAISIRFFQLDQAQMVRQAQSQMTHLEMHLINRTEKGKVVEPEIIASSDGSKQLMLAHPVFQSVPKSDEYPEGKVVVGTLLLIVNLSELTSQLEKNGVASAQTQLSQRIDREPKIVFLALGAGGDYPKVAEPIDNTHWQVEVVPTDAMFDQARQPRLWFYIGFLVLALFLSAVGWWLGHRLSLGKVDAFSANKKLLAEGKKEIEETNEADLGAVDDLVVDEEDTLLLIDENVPGSGDSAKEFKGDLPDSIFRSYDIRGIAGDEITDQVAELIGKAIASEALDQGDDALIVARDGRDHSQDLCEKMIEGILSTGCDVIDVGLVPTPLMNFAALTSDKTNSGVMVTASHNPKEYNGFKFLINGKTLADKKILALKTTIEAGNFHLGNGSREFIPVVDDYIDRIFSDVALAGHLHVVIDAANGATSNIAPRLFEELGCDVTPLFCEIDGSFPNHPPNPSDPNNLVALIEKVKEEEADLGIALDGDGDRLVVVTASGEIVWPDRLLMLFAKDVVSRNPGCDVIYDVKSTRELSKVIASYGGRPVMWKTGHSHMKSKMQEMDALLAGEFSGHIFFKERWYGFDDGMYAAARLLEILTIRDQDLDSALDSFPKPPSTPEIIVPVDESEKFSLIDELVSQCDFPDGKQTHIDGLRVDFSKGWGLVRASNTAAAITLRFEADDDAALEDIMALFKVQINKVSPELSLPF